MNCSKARSLMLDYLYDDLGPRKQKALRKHLRACGECSKELAAHKATVSTFNGLRMEEPPAGISEKIAAIAANEIERHERARAKSSRYWRPALASAAAAALVVITVVYYLPRATKDRMVARTSQVAWQRGEVSEQRESAVALSKNGAYKGQDGASARKMDSDFSVGSASDSLGNESSRSNIATEDYRGRDLKYSAPAMASPAPSAERPLAGLELRERAGEVSAQSLADEGTVAGSIHAPVTTAEPQKILSGAKEAAKQEPASEVAEEVLKEREAKYKTAEDELAEGNAYFDRLDFGQAATHYEKVIDLEAQQELTAEARYRLGRSYQEMKQWEKAVAVYEGIIKNEPDFPQMGEVYIAAGECYLAMSRSEDALRAFEIVRDRFPAMRGLALQKIDLAVSQQKETEKANQPPRP